MDKRKGLLHNHLLENQNQQLSNGIKTGYETMNIALEIQDGLQVNIDKMRGTDDKVSRR